MIVHPLALLLLLDIVPNVVVSLSSSSTILAPPQSPAMPASFFEQYTKVKLPSSSIVPRQEPQQEQKYHAQHESHPIVELHEETIAAAATPVLLLPARSSAKVVTSGLGVCQSRQDYDLEMTRCLLLDIGLTLPVLQDTRSQTTSRDELIQAAKRSHGYDDRLPTISRPGSLTLLYKDDDVESFSTTVPYQAAAWNAYVQEYCHVTTTPVYMDEDSLSSTGLNTEHAPCFEDFALAYTETAVQDVTAKHRQRVREAALRQLLLNHEGSVLYESSFQDGRDGSTSSALEGNDASLADVIAQSVTQQNAHKEQQVRTERAMENIQHYKPSVSMATKAAASSSSTTTPVSVGATVTATPQYYENVINSMNPADILTSVDRINNDSSTSSTPATVTTPHHYENVINPRNPDILPASIITDRINSNEKSASSPSVQMDKTNSQWWMNPHQFTPSTCSTATIRASSSTTSISSPHSNAVAVGLPPLVVRKSFVDNPSVTPTVLVGRQTTSKRWMTSHTGKPVTASVYAPMVSTWSNSGQVVAATAATSPQFSQTKLPLHVVPATYRTATESSMSYRTVEDYKRAIIESGNGGSLFPTPWTVGAADGSTINPYNYRTILVES